MVTRVNGGVFNTQFLTGSLRHFVIEGANFSGAVNEYGQPVPGSAADIIFNIISQEGFIDIMNPNSYNISFALEIHRSDWDGPSLTSVIQALGTDVGVDHVDCSVCIVTEVPYIWDIGGGGVTEFIQLSDVPNTYSGSANYAVMVNPSATGLIFVPFTPDAFSSIQVASQPTITAGINSALTFVAGTNITLVTNSSSKSVTINSTSSPSGDYIPVPPGTSLSISSRYFVTGSGTVTLPVLTGSGYSAGQSVYVTKVNANTVFINVGSVSDIITTDIGTTTSLEFDATQELIFVYDGSNSWDLQIGSNNV